MTDAAVAHPGTSAAVVVRLTHSSGTVDIANNRSYLYVDQYLAVTAANGAGGPFKTSPASTAYLNSSLGSLGTWSGGYDLRPASSLPSLHLIHWEGWVTHDSDGSKTVTFDFGFSGNGGTPLGSGSGSDSRALPSIPKAPSAPAIGTLTQNSISAATLTWSAPASNGGSAITGYRITYATNASFTGATTLDVGTVTSRQLTGLTPGLRVYAKVAALNAATAAGLALAYSSTVSLQLIAEVGDLDGWASFGTLPGGLTPIVSGALRRGSVTVLGSSPPLGLIREVQSSGSGSVTISTLGIQRTMTGLTVGATYELSASMVGLESSTPPASIYRLGVQGIGTGATAEISGTAPVTLPTYSFVATDTSHVLRIYLAEGASWSGSGWFEAVAFYGLKVTEIPNTSPYRLQDVAYESSLANHFTLACDTVGAAWWVDRENVTRFRQAESQDAIVATFTDARAPGKLEYVDITAAYDTANTVNALRVNNHGRDPETGNADDVTYSATDAASAAEWGTRAGTIDMSLYSPEGEELEQRIGEVLAKHSTPEVVISSIRWNAQEDPQLAARLDIQDRVRVEFRETVQDSRIVGLKHTMEGARWMVDVELAKS